MLRSIRNGFYLFRIFFLLIREDALFVIEAFSRSSIGLSIAQIRIFKKNVSRGKRLYNVLQQLGPSFIKLGQTLSTRADLIGEELAAELASLRDALPPFSNKEARNIIEEELFDTLENIFASFQESPIAAASIAQVHKATLKDGNNVAVKVLRPDVEQKFQRDLDLFFWLAEIIEQRMPASRRLKPVEVVQTFQQSVYFELDLRYEAAAATEMAENIKHDSGFKVPKIFWEHTTQRVMVVEWVDGIPINNIDALKAAGHNLDLILETAAVNFFRHVFRDGFFHADLHPGNLFVDRNGDVVAVDFGIMGRLDWQSRLYVAEILRGFLNEDYAHVARAHFKAGYVPEHQSLQLFTQACRAITKPIINKPLYEISVARLLGQLFNVTEAFQMETQPQLLLLQKTMVVVEGVGRLLNPKINMWELARPPIEEWGVEHLSAKGKLQHTAQNTAEILRDLPHTLDKFSNALSLLSDPKGMRIHPTSLQAFENARTEQTRIWLKLSIVLAITVILITLID